VIGRKVLRAALLCSIAIGMSVAVAGCGGTAAKKGSEPTGVEVEHSEEVAQHKAEAAETTEDQEVLQRIEAKKREEAAEENAQRTEALASARAKKREQAAAKQAKHKEQVAEANVKKREEALKAAAKKKQAEAKKVKEEEQKLSNEQVTHAGAQAKPGAAPASRSDGVTPEAQTTSTGQATE
jgi:fused signal recognition particle receptor